MKIKDVESRCKLERANIRFYEKEGFINPTRQQNGYREYSESDVDILLKIKLLRSLKISIDEIHSIQNEEVSLSDSLSLKIKELKTEKKETEKTIELCEVIKNDGPVFKDLDADKYLNYNICANLNLIYNADTDKMAEKPYPYYSLRRYVARCTELGLYNTIISLGLIWTFKINIMNTGSWFNSLTLFLAMIVMIFIEPLLLKLFGTTFGKFIFGLEIKNMDDNNLSYAQGYARTKAVLWDGMGFNIPVFSWFRIWKSYKQCSSNEKADWDLAVNYTIKKDRAGLAYVACAAILIVSIFSYIGMNRLLLVPPNKGDLSIEEFVENYNYLYTYILGQNSGLYLDENGNWMEDTGDNGSLIIELIDYDYPDLKYTLTDDKIDKVEYNIELYNIDDWYYMSENELIIVALALNACSYNETNKIPGDFSNDFNLEFNNATIINQVESKNTIMGTGVVVKDDENSDTYFHQSYIVDIQ